MPRMVATDIPGVMLGADPEFEWKSKTGRFVHADDVRDSMHGALGTDGSSYTGEIRPGPGNAETVIRNISRILTRAERMHSHWHTEETLEMFAGAGTEVPLGGHIHFSGIRTSAAFIRQLDKFIAVPLRSISNQSRRSNHGYGDLGETRDQPHGWEYRAPCSWISHPIITEGVVHVAYELARAEKNGEISMIVTEEDLIRYTRRTSNTVANKIKKFFKTIERMKRNHVNLEAVEVFQAWKKRPRENDSNEEIKVRAEFSFNRDDFNLDEIATMYSTRGEKNREHGTVTSYRVIGASRERNHVRVNWNTIRVPDHAIFVNSELKAKLPRSVFGCRVFEWEYNTIGLSYNLRRDVKKSVEVLLRIRWALKEKRVNAIKVMEES